MSKEGKRLLVIDGNSLIHRAFYALPLLSTKDNIYTNGVYGFLTMLYRIEEEYEYDYISVAFDKKKGLHFVMRPLIYTRLIGPPQLQMNFHCNFPY